VTCISDYTRGFGFGRLNVSHLLHAQISLQQRYRYSTHFQFSITHAIGFSVITSRILATDLSQSRCTFNSHMKSSCKNLIPFLRLSCSCQFRRFDSTRLLFSPQSRLMCPLITPRHGPLGKHRLILSRMRVYCSVT
jgi:hypothetical protein